MSTERLQQRVAYSPGEFADLFGKSQTWGYRQIYQGRVNAITQHGRILIPAKEVERVLESAGIYNGKEKPKKAKERQEAFSPEQKNIWQRFVELRRKAPIEISVGKANPRVSVPAAKSNPNTRKAVLGRIANSWAGKQPEH